ncbi:hypothetical protein ACHAXR_006222 [Thalassiosira sp. AJA248-18]
MGVAIGRLLSIGENYNLGGCRESKATPVSIPQHYSGDVLNKTILERSTKPETPFIEEYIPANLLPQYQPQHFQFNVTRSMLRQSRPVVGNIQRLHAYLRKLQAGQCTTVLVLGGSVSAGHHVIGPHAYPQNLVKWLNGRYPCKQDDGSRSTHQYKKTHATNSQTHMTSWSMVDGIESFDLVIFEFNINDNFIPDLPHSLEDKGPVGNMKEYRSLWYFEVLLRRILLVKKPDPPAVITFNADYLGRPWTNPPHWDPEEARKTLFYSNHEPMKIWLSSLYEIPVFSAAIWMLPLAGKRGRDMQFNKTNPYSTRMWHTDVCCHPRAEGHLILSLVLAYCLVEEEKLMPSYDDAEIVDEENDFTTLDTPLLRDPVYLSPEEEDLYVKNSLAYSGVDFTDPSSSEASWKDIIVANEGWTWYADNKDKDKFGYIADGVSGRQHMAIALTGGQHGMVEISYIVSYENFGTAVAWFDGSSKSNQSICNRAIDTWEQAKSGKPQRLFASWDEKASVPKIDMLQKKLKQGTKKILHICLTPKSDTLAVLGKENKFKLLGVRVY